MNNEIKEILEYLKDKNDYIEDFGIAYKRIHIDNGDLKILLDYITNLQIIEREYSAILSENAELQQENERLYLDNTMIKLEKDIYKQGYEDFKNLIDTLQNGSDNE